MSSNGVFLGDGPSWLSYEDKLCPKCGDMTMIKVSHSMKNPNKLYHRCNTHKFVDWCLPINVEITPSPPPTTYHGIAQSKWNKGVHDLKVCLKNRYWDLTASCDGNSIPAVVCLAIVFLVFVVVSVKFNVI